MPEITVQLGAPVPNAQRNTQSITPSAHYGPLAARFKLLAHPERLRILDVLRREPECVCHLEALLNKPQPYVSQQLRILREAGVIEDEKRGNNVYYRLVDTEIEQWLACALGPVAGQDAELAYYKTVIACSCPKCDGWAKRVERRLFLR